MSNTHVKTCCTEHSLMECRYMCKATVTAMGGGDGVDVIQYALQSMYMMLLVRALFSITACDQTSPFQTF